MLRLKKKGWESYLLLLFCLLCVTVFISSCKNDDNPTLPQITGKAGEIIVVIEKKYWESAVGSSLRSCLASEHIALPQPEPIFDLVNIPRSAFSGILKSHRNILLIEIKTGVKPSITIRKDAWATPQLVISIMAPDAASFTQLIKKNKKRLIDAIETIERNRLITKYASLEKKSISEKLLKKFHLSMTVPKGYEIAKEAENIIWIRRETPETSQGILIYHYANTGSNIFTKENIITVRDSVTKLHIPGPTEGSYMTTMHDYPVTIRSMNFYGFRAVETRGLWDVHGDFMGGPFISYTLIDEQRNRVVVAEGYVYAPKFNKRNYLRQLEAILYSLKIE